MHKGKSRKSHTGPVRHADMESYLDGHGGPDKHASPEHHAANREAGMDHGFSHMGHGSMEMCPESENECYE